MTKPFSQACENNKAPILAVLRNAFAETHRVLEVGSGTGQHAICFAEHLPHLTWQTSDLTENHAAIMCWLDDYPGNNLLPPLTLDVGMPWPTDPVDAIFSANTLHIMSFASVESFFDGVKKHLQENGLLVVYGPFNYNGAFTSDSNARFNLWLKEQNPDSAIRDFAAVDALAEKAGLKLLDDIAMPANNRILVWKKTDQL